MGIGRRSLRGVGAGVRRVRVSPLREEMVRESRTLWWSEKADLWMEEMVWVMSTVWCGSCTAKWSMDDVDD